MSFRLTREQLYDLVWSEAMHKLGRQIGISDVALAKHCRKHGIPIPPRGYWNKLHAGKKATRIALPLRDLGTINCVEISGTLTPELLGRIRGEPGACDPEGQDLDLLTERFRQRLGTVTVPRGFTRTHPVIAKLLGKDEEHRQKKLTERFYWRQPQFDSPFELRRLRILNGLLLAFAKVGCGGIVTGEQARELTLSVGDRQVGFTLDRLPHRRAGRAAPSADGADKLCLTIVAHDPPAGVRLRWQDEEGTTLEEQITDLVVGMAIAVEQLQRDWRAKRLVWERERREEAERAALKRKAEEERLERERQAALAKAKIDRLRRDAEAWRASADIRAYVAAALGTVGEGHKERAEAWALWALGVADSIDPLASGRAAERIMSFGKDEGPPRDVVSEVIDS